jgi:tetratricopeptide (TPR) repeat protein
MPFGQKTDPAGLVIDFDKVYERLIKPVIEQAGLHPIRADEEQVGGIIHKPMYERLILCEYAVADLTSANANVFYELGVHHAVRPCSTVLIFAQDTRLPFDVGPLRGLPYALDAAGEPKELETTRQALVERLKAARETDKDSPLFQLVDDMQPQQISHAKTDVFRAQVEYSERVKDELTEARKQGVGAIQEVEERLGDLGDAEAGIIIDLLLSYRAVKAWDRMISLVERMPRPLAATVMVQEQYALALNRNGQGEKAERVLTDLIARRGPSSETYGILGRVYKDRWEGAVKAGQGFLAKGLLDKAVDAYVRGFEADPRDAYPGVNAVTLMELQDPPDPRRLELLPVVKYAVRRKLRTGQPDYWDYATLLELAVLERDENGARVALTQALPEIREVWEPETTVRNLRLIREARARRHQQPPWAQQVEDILMDAAKRFAD